MGTPPAGPIREVHPSAALGSRIRLATLIAVVAALALPGILYYISEPAYQLSTWILVVASTALAVVMVVTGSPAPARRAGALLLVFAYALLQLSPQLFPSGYVLWWAFLFGSLSALFLAWALSSGFRSRGYFGILIGAGFFVVMSILESLFEGGYLLSPLLVTGTILGTVLISRRLERRGRLAAAVAGPAGAMFDTSSAGYTALPTSAVSSQGYPAKANMFAMLSLIFGLLSGSVLAIVFGHLAKSQIRKSGETGGGLATAGLVLGYFWLAAGAVLLIAYVVILGRGMGWR